MYAEACRELPDGGLWTYEAKLDGYRCLAAKRNGKAVVWSRRGNGFTGRFPAIAHACDNLPADTMIDGEVVAVDPNGRVSTPYSTADRRRTFSFMLSMCSFITAKVSCGCR
jgi:ATP-dependent DNA ligase